MVASVAPVAGENSPAPTLVGSASEAIDRYEQAAENAMFEDKRALSTLLDRPSYVSKARHIDA